MRPTRILCEGKKISVYRSNSVNPFVNLAIESWLFAEPKDPKEYSLYLWRNGPSVIIGKFQSAWRECNVKKMEDEKVNLVRRSSGGGAVYQDLGNSIFSFISPKDDKESIPRNNRILLNALASTKTNIQAAATGRNDLHLDGRKISGAAFKNTRERSLHHGTLLLNLDVTALDRYLTPNKLKLQSKGVTSVQAHVLNLQTIDPTLTHEVIGDSIKNAFFQEHNSTCEVIDIDESILEKEKHVRETVAQLQDWDWRFGSKEPKFTHELGSVRFSWGTFDVNVIVNKGVIEDIHIYTDALDVPLIEALKVSLTGVVYSHLGVTQALEAFLVSPMLTAEAGLQVREFREWLVKSL